MKEYVIQVVYFLKKYELYQTLFVIIFSLILFFIYYFFWKKRDFESMKENYENEISDISRKLSKKYLEEIKELRRINLKQLEEMQKLKLRNLKLESDLKFMSLCNTNITNQRQYSKEENNE